MKERVLITGAAGFIGSHVAVHLDDRYDVIALVRMNKIGDLHRLNALGFYGTVVWHDLKSPITASVANRIGPVDHIIHLGAETHVDRSIEDPVEFAFSNVIGTTNLLQFARDVRHPLKTFIQFSTDEVFGPADIGEYHLETSPYNSKNPYAASKAGAEQMVVAFGHTYGLNTIVIRSMNAFGDMQHSEKFIPKIIRSVLLEETIPIHSSPDLSKAGSRFYIHVDNISKGIQFVIDHHDEDRIQRIGTKFYHLVGEKEVDNLQMATFISRFIGKSLKYDLVNFHASRPGHDLRYALFDNYLKRLGWTIPESFEASLERTVKWYLDNKEWLRV